MAKFKILKPFRDVETNEVYKKNQEIEMTVKRADEAAANLKKYDGAFLERVEEKKKQEEGE